MFNSFFNFLASLHVASIVSVFLRAYCYHHYYYFARIDFFLPFLTLSLESVRQQVFMTLLSILCEFFTLVLIGGFSPNSTWPQIFLDDQDSCNYQSWFKLSWGLDSINSFSNLQFPKSCFPVLATDPRVLITIASLSLWCSIIFSVLRQIHNISIFDPFYFHSMVFRNDKIY